MYYSTPQKQVETNKISIRDKKNWTKIIDNYWANCSTPFTVKDVQVEINKKIGINCPRALLTMMMKSEWNLSYKRISSRPKRFIMNDLSASRVLFWTKFLNDLTEDTLIVNIDETIFNRNWKINYSWGLRGVEKECQNEYLVNSINMILALCSNGSWMALIANDSINSK